MEEFGSWAEDNLYLKVCFAMFVEVVLESDKRVLLHLHPNIIRQD